MIAHMRCHNKEFQSMGAIAITGALHNQGDAGQGKVPTLPDAV
jgi:hypothetical protein